VLGLICHDEDMKSSFDDPVLLSAMQTYLAAVAQLEGATDDAEIMQSSQAKSMAAMTLRKRFEELGWLAPARLRVGGPS
jgi:hypothetical protein